jgi:GNAT superfamily N-acetyltransferase
LGELNFYIASITGKDVPERDHLFGKLREWTKDKASHWTLSQQEEWVTIVARDERDEIIGGLFGDAFLGCFYIRIFWVEEDYRGRGLGGKLLEEMEQRARESGCATMGLDTFDFQAEGFYLKHGYERFGAMEYFPGGPTKIYMKKTL